MSELKRTTKSIKPVSTAVSKAKNHTKTKPRQYVDNLVVADNADISIADDISIVADKTRDIDSSAGVSAGVVTIHTENSVADMDSAAKELNIAEMCRLYNGGMSIRNIGDYFGLGTEKVIKILVTSNVYSSELYDKIKLMRECGMSDDVIRQKLKLSERAYFRYVPYKQGVYNLDCASENAKRLREWKKRKREL